MPYSASSSRYDNMEYRRSGRSGLKLPAISLGLWQNFGGTRDYPSALEILTYAFDQASLTLIWPTIMARPPGSSEELFGQMMQHDFKPIAMR